MSPAVAAPAAWKSMGAKLARRRVDLDVRYQNRTVFCAERGIDYRLSYDIEEARRTNFRPTTLIAIASAYAVTADSLHAALAGAALEPLPAPSPAAPSHPVLVPGLPQGRLEDMSDAEIERLIAGNRNAERVWNFPDQSRPWPEDPREPRPLLPRRERIGLVAAVLHAGEREAVPEAPREDVAGLGPLAPGAMITNRTHTQEMVNIPLLPVKH